MTDVDFDRLDELFHAALELEEGERAAFLDEHCAEEPALRRELEDMLAVSTDDRGAEQWFGDVIAAVLDDETQPGTEQLDDVPGAPECPVVGPYRILEELGRGGLGTVYRAERVDAEYSREVALKLVRTGLDSPHIRERFRFERQVLAKLDHPHIARLYDGGTTEDGQPYFVMELIDGERLDDWCRLHQVPLRQRLEMMRKVCDAVHYAHRNLVLHRDLKPSNILVNQEGEPKLLDFGIAKVLDHDPASTQATPVAESPALTLTGHLLLTPEFASPEQVRAETLTTASDVYALGVVLYYLVTGRPPYEMDRRRASEVERVVCEVEPRRPSTVARQSPSDTIPGWTPSASGDDLDNIIGMALRKEPERRYTSAAELSEDLGRYLNDMPILARADSVTYRLRKFVRRNRVPVAASALVLLTLVVAVIVTSWQMSVAIHEKKATEQVTELLVESFLTTDPFEGTGGVVSVREFLDRSTRQIRDEVADDARLRGKLLGVLGRVYRNRAHLQPAEELLEEAVRALRDQGSQGRDLAEILIELGKLRLSQERALEAKDLFEEASHLWRRGLFEDGLGEARIQRFLGKTYAQLEEYAQAEAHFQRALALAEAGGFEIERIYTLDDLGEMWHRRRDQEKSYRYFEQALDLRGSLFGKEHPKVGQALNNVGAALHDRGDFTAAVGYYRRALEVFRASLGPKHSEVANTLHNLAKTLLFQGKAEAAEEKAHEALALTSEIFGDEHPRVAWVLRLLARVHHLSANWARKGGLPETEKAHWEKAEECAQRALELDKAHFGRNHSSEIDNRFLIADLARARDRPEAVELFRDTLALLATAAPDDVRMVEVLVKMGEVEMGRGNWGDAESSFRQALAEMDRLGFRAESWEVAEAQGNLGICLATQGRAEDALPWVASSRERFAAVFPDSGLTRRLTELEQELRAKLGTP